MRVRLSPIYRQHNIAQKTLTDTNLCERFLLSHYRTATNTDKCLFAARDTFTAWDDHRPFALRQSIAG